MLSYPTNIPRILEVVKGLNPKRVLDIGPGFGKFGLLIREQYLSDKAASGELEPSDDISIDCLELTDYFTNRSALHAIYDTVIEADFREGDALGYDLVLLIDVVEHYPKEEILKWLRAQKDCRILISTPINVTMYTDHFYGDPHHHESQWALSDFAEFEIENHSSDLSFILVVKR